MAPRAKQGDARDEGERVQRTYAAVRYVHAKWRVEPVGDTRRQHDLVLCQVSIGVERVETGCSETPGPIAALAGFDRNPWFRSLGSWPRRCLGIVGEAALRRRCVSLVLPIVGAVRKTRRPAGHAAAR